MLNNSKNIKDSMYVIGIYIILLCLSVIGANIMNNYEYNKITMLFLLFVSLVPIYIISKQINMKFYPWLIHGMSISILFHKALIGISLWGYDVFKEYYYAGLVLNSSFWDYSGSGNINGSLSIVLLAPVLSHILGVDLTHLFKVVYVIIYSFVPVILYFVYKEVFNPIVAFLASFYFMSTAGYYEEMLHLCREQIAELFFALVLFIVIRKAGIGLKKKIITIIFIISMLLAHYAMAYLVMLMFIICYLTRLTVSILLNKNKIQLENKYALTLNLILLCTTVALFWHIFTTNMTVFISVIGLLKDIVTSLKGFLNPQYVGGIDALVTRSTLIREIAKFINIAALIFVSFGLIERIRNWRKHVNTYMEYYLLSISAYIICVLAMTVPNFTAMHSTRLLHICLILLSPFCVTGAIVFIQWAAKIIKGKILDARQYILISLYLSLLFLFSVGFVFEIADNYSTIALDSTLDVPMANQKEMHTHRWLNAAASRDIPIYGDNVSKTILFMYFTEDSLRDLGTVLGSKDIGGYFYLREQNLNTGTIRDHIWNRQHRENIDISYSEETFADYNKIYNNGASDVYIAGKLAAP